MHYITYFFWVFPATVHDVGYCPVLSCYPLGSGANSLSLTFGLGTWAALRLVPVEQSGQIGFSWVNWLCWIPLYSNPVWAPAPWGGRLGPHVWAGTVKIRASLPHFCNSASARTPLLCWDILPYLPTGHIWNIVLLEAACREGPPWRSSISLTLGWMVGLEPKKVSLHIKGSIVLPLLPSTHTHQGIVSRMLCVKRPFLLKRDT